MRLRPIRRLAMAYARVRYRRVPEPMPIWAEHGGVFWTWSTMETMQEATWRHLKPNVRYLGLMQAARIAGCSWCVDFGNALASRAGVRDEQLLNLAEWRTSPLYNDQERLAMELADAMSRTPVEVPPGLMERCQAAFGEKGAVELAACIALENMRSRFNGAFGLVTAGWSRLCETPVHLEDRRAAV